VFGLVDAHGAQFDVVLEKYGKGLLKDALSYSLTPRWTSLLLDKATLPN